MAGAIDFDALYGIDLVYRPQCWTLCGDAHCCSFQRHKSSFRFLYRSPGQELPLLPGETEFLRERGLLAQFEDHQLRSVPYRFGDRTIRIESVISRRAGCACDHATRTTVCRLYPFLPVLDIDGRLIGVERLGVFDLLEDLGGLPRAYQVDEIPREELAKLLDVVRLIGASPLALFQLEAYRRIHAHLRARLETLRASSKGTIFAVMESAFIRGTLVDASFEREMIELADRYEARYGAGLFEHAPPG